MPRIRTIKPEMAQDEDLALCSLLAQLLAVRVLCHCDDEGYFKAHPSLVVANCFPLTDDIDSGRTTVALRELSKAGYLWLGDGTDGKQYGKVRGFTTHQKINKPTASKFKDLVDISVELREDYGSAPGGLPGGKERKGKERKGKEGKGNAPSAKRFEDFWSQFPRKKAKMDAEKAWKQGNCDNEADVIIADVINRIENDAQWRKKESIAYPATYLRGKRWTDEMDGDHDDFAARVARGVAMADPFDIPQDDSILEGEFYEHE